MDESEVARRWANIEQAVHELGRRRPETRPAIIDHQRATVQLGSGELLRLDPLLQASSDRQHPDEVGEALDYLIEAREAANDVAALAVGSWAAMAPRLGLVVRPCHPDLIGPTVKPHLQLVVAIDAGTSLIPVTGSLLERWDRSPSTVIEIAGLNTAHHPVEARQIPLVFDSTAGHHAAAGVLTGGAFTAGRIVDRASIERALESPSSPGDLLAVGLGDRALLIAWWADRPCPTRLSDLAHALQKMADDLRRRMSIRPASGGTAIVRCRSDGQVAIFRTGGDEQ